MGDWPKVIWDKLPMLFGQIMLQGYLVDPALGFCGIGDTLTQAGVNAGHAYKPLQVTEFASGTRIDDELKKLSETSGNGPDQHHEPYGLAMFYYARCVDFPNCNGKPVLFLTADEFFYETISKAAIKKCIGVKVDQQVRTEDIMRGLRAKYEVFVIKKVYDTHAGFEDSISAQWETIISRERILRLNEPKAVVDVMLGAISIAKGTRSLEKYGQDMKSRGQDRGRMDLVNSTLAGFAAQVETGEDPCNEAAALAAELLAVQAELASLRAGAGAENDSGLARKLSGDLMDVKSEQNKSGQAPPSVKDNSNRK